MVEHRSQFRLYDVDTGGFDEGLIESQPRPYRFGPSANDYAAHQEVPHFLSNPDGEPDPEEFIAALRKSRAHLVSSKTLIAVVAAFSVAMLFAWFSSDATREMVVNAKSSIAAAVQSPFATTNTAQLTANELRFARMSAPAGQAAKSAPAAAPAPATMVASITPSREEISNAYQSALQARAAAAAPPTTVASITPPREGISNAYQSALQARAAATPAALARRIDEGELATLIKRAKDLLAMDDIPSARLLLERAAEAQDASAALMLARTYDAEVIGSADVRDITPEPAKARAWYQKAAVLGSAEAERRLAQLPK